MNALNDYVAIRLSNAPVVISSGNPPRKTTDSPSPSMHEIYKVTAHMRKYTAQLTATIYTH